MLMNFCKCKVRKKIQKKEKSSENKKYRRIV